MGYLYRFIDKIINIYNEAMDYMDHLIKMCFIVCFLKKNYCKTLFVLKKIKLTLMDIDLQD